MNNMGREIMAALKRFQVGSDGDGVTVGGALVVSGATTLTTVSATVVQSDTVSEKTSAAGVTIDGVLLKDNGVVTGAGTVSAPVYSTTGDTNTGIFFPAADQVAVATNGVERVNLGNSATVFNDGGANVDFRVEGDTDANLLFVDASADVVGIGTSSPGFKFDVRGQNGTNVAWGYNIANIVDGQTNNSGLRIASNSSTAGICQLVAATNNDASQFGFWTYNGSAWGERMRINSSGNVGIGTSSPGDKLDVNGKSTFRDNIRLPNTNYIYSYAGGTSTTVRSGFYLDGTNNILTALTNDAERARITSGGYFKAQATTSYFNSSGAFHELLSNDASEPVVVVYNKNGSYTGNMIQGYSDRTPSAGVYKWIQFMNGGVARFQVLDTGDVQNANNSYGGTSDEKLKQDIVDAGSQWNDIKNLRVRKYRWKSEPDGFMQLGLVAQEAELVSPGLIEELSDYEEVEVTDEEGNVTTERQATGTVTKSVKYSILYMKAVKALQEAMERIETLEAKNDALEARIAALEQA
jgi:hypothetical protein